jgi:hypothetical protein
MPQSAVVRKTADFGSFSHLQHEPWQPSTPHQSQRKMHLP